MPLLSRIDPANTNKLKALNDKANYFEILHQNIASLNKNIYNLSNDLSMMKFGFPVIGFRVSQIGSSGVCVGGTLFR